MVQYYPLLSIPPSTSSECCTNARCQESEPLLPSKRLWTISTSTFRLTCSGLHGVPTVVHGSRMARLMAQLWHYILGAEYIGSTCWMSRGMKILNGRHPIGIVLHIWATGSVSRKKKEGISPTISTTLTKDMKAFSIEIDIWLAWKTFRELAMSVRLYYDYFEYVGSPTFPQGSTDSTSDDPCCFTGF
jgi:hypothetical protein